MPEKIILRAVPANAAGPLAPYLQELDRLLRGTVQELNESKATIRTLEELLKGNAPGTSSTSYRLPPVTGFTVNKLENSIQFVLQFPHFKTQPKPPGFRVELWRALENEDALNAEFVKQTTSQGLDDHPPPGIKYRYWMRYRDNVDSETGPFSPVDGIEFTAAEVTNPEAEFDLGAGGIFLETFEDMDINARWSEIDPANNVPVITYPSVGIVGGVVAQFAGDEAWRVFNDLIPFDPQTLYRVRVGVRYTTAPTNPAKMKFFAGVTCVAADGSTLINEAGLNLYTNQHFVAAKNADLISGGINNWQTFTGYIAALGTPVTPANSISAPTPLFPGTKYMKPTFVVNFDDGDGTVQLDYFRIEALDPLDIALNGNLSPAAITLPANQLGDVLTYTPATGTFEVRYGSQLLNGSSAVVFSILANPQSLAGSINSAGVFSFTSGFDRAETTASVTFRATFLGTSVDRTIIFTKAQDGDSNWTPVQTGQCVISGDTITKVGGASAWDSDVRSIEGYTEGAFVSAQAGQTNAAVMVALNSDPNTDSTFSSLDYAWYFMAAGTLEIYENGTTVGSFGAYSTSTVLAIRHIGALVQYIKDGIVVRSVTRTATTPLFFDCSFFTPNSVLAAVKFGPAGRGAEADPSAVFLETFENSWETSFQNVANASGVVVTYPNNGQFGGRVIRAQNQLYISSNENIPFDDTALYRITTRMRRIASGSPQEFVYCGMRSIAADGVTDVSVDPWNCASSFDMSTIALNTWKDFVGYVRGKGSTLGVAPNIDAPTNLAATAAFFRPMLVLNFSSGTGTMECDFIKVERLTNPTDADNTEKRRIVPDAEFTRTTTNEFWYLAIKAGGSVSFSTTGGNIGGKAVLTNGTDIVSRRRPPYYMTAGNIYTVTVRWRRTTAFGGIPPANSGFRFGAYRHSNDPELTTFNVANAVSAAGNVLKTYAAIAASTLNKWYEENTIVWFPRDSTIASNDKLFLSAYLSTRNYSGTIEIDFLDVQPGIGADPFKQQTPFVAGAFNMQVDDLYIDWQHLNGGAADLFLPPASADIIGGKAFGTQGAAGTVTIKPSGADTLRWPGGTGNKALIGQDAKYVAECISPTEWRLTGDI